jgi:HSP20 family molecular chaperone IbpA
MRSDDPQGWMWSEAVAMLTRAERLHRQFFQPGHSAHRPAWEPPADVLELEREVLILVALPGVDPEQVATVIEDGALVVSGRRLLPPQLATAVIHRLELPQGRFERRVPLPPGHYAAARRTSAHGCLVISLRKMG